MHLLMNVQSLYLQACNVIGMSIDLSLTDDADIHRGSFEMSCQMTLGCWCTYLRKICCGIVGQIILIYLFLSGNLCTKKLFIIDFSQNC